MLASFPTRMRPASRIPPTDSETGDIILKVREVFEKQITLSRRETELVSSYLQKRPEPAVK